MNEKSISSRPTIRGRGANVNPTGRFESISYLEDDNIEKISQQPLKTQFYKDSSKSIITYNKSPDIEFNASINPYRGCEHGCIYCYARPTHEYFGFSGGLDFETKIMVKEEAPQLLRKELARPTWRSQPIAISGVTDPYQPIERKSTLTRQCLQVLAEFRNPAGIITKNYLVTRDMDILQELSQYHACTVTISITTLQPKLARLMEPRTVQPERRLKAVAELADCGIPVGVLLAPVIPGLNDHEIPAIIQAAADAGAQYAGYIVLRLPYGVGELFEEWLTQHFPDKKHKVLSRIRDIRGGKLNESQFHARMRGYGEHGKVIDDLFKLACRKAGLPNPKPVLSTAAFRNPFDKQPTLF